MDSIRPENNSNGLNAIPSEDQAITPSMVEPLNNEVNPIEQQATDVEPVTQTVEAYPVKTVADFIEDNAINSPSKKKSKLKIILPIICVLIVAAIGISVFVYQSSDSVKYKKALDAIDNGSYVYAKSILAEIADYEDAKSKTIEVNYLILLEHIRTNGASKGSDYVITHNITDDGLNGTIVLTARSDNTIVFDVKQTNSIGKISSNFVISPTENIINIDASRELIITLLGKTGVGNESGKGTIDRSTYKHGAIALFYDYSDVGTFNDIDTQDSFAKIISEALATSIEYLEDLIKTPEIGLTMSDLGFYAY